MTRRFTFWPRTRLGWWAVGLAVVFVVLMLINAYVLDQIVFTYEWIGFIVRWYASLVLASAVIGTLCAVRAITRLQDTALLVWVSMVPLLLSVLFMLGELIYPH